MQIKAEIPMSELEHLVSKALTSEYPDMFPHGAEIMWKASDNQRDGTSVSVTATPRRYVQGKD